jgi:hypothetical protein
MAKINEIKCIINNGGVNMAAKQRHQPNDGVSIMAQRKYRASRSRIIIAAPSAQT